MFYCGRAVRALSAIALVGSMLWLVAGDASAQQPSKIDPTASSVKEQQLLDALKPPATGGTSAISGRLSIPDQRGANVIQPQGTEFRSTHQSTVPRIGAIAILGILAALVLFYLVRGKVRISTGASSATIDRFGFVDRFAHWLTASSFIILGLTGLNLTFGKSIVLPIVGPEAFTALATWGKIAHNYLSFAFVLGIVLMFLLWVKDNIPHPRDILWIVQGGGLVGLGHPAAARFNFGQKVIFWAVILGGVALSVSGYVMMFPFTVTDIGGQQLAIIVHGLVGLVLVAIIIAHIYIGSVGMEGAFAAMGSGKVDLNWAKEHHSIWVDRVSKNKPGAIHGAKVSPAE